MNDLQNNREFCAVFGVIGFLVSESSRVRPEGTADISRGQDRQSGRRPRTTYHRSSRPEKTLEANAIKSFRRPAGAQNSLCVFPWGGANSLPQANVLCSFGASPCRIPNHYSTGNNEEPF